MDRDSYRAASFLDDRMLQVPQDLRYLPWSNVAAAAQKAVRSEGRWIFHIGHVGSTLMARLMGELPSVLSVREPRFLRDIATVEGRHEYTAAVPALFSRTFAANEKALVKATSFVSEIAPELVPEGARALFMYASPQRYIASILAGDASRQELAAYAQSRAARLAPRVMRMTIRSEADLAAAAWASEMTALEAAADAMQDRRINWIDFDRALAALPETLLELANFFGFDASTLQIDAIAAGPLTRRYSKALEYDYSPDLRRDVIAEAARQHARAISAALAMLEDAAQDSPLLARALTRSTSEA